MIGRGRVKGGSSASGEQSWRELAGPKKGRVNSAQAKRRRLAMILRLCAMAVGVLLIAGAGYFTVRSLQTRETPIEITTPSLVIESLMFETDGVLSNRWLSQTIGLSAGTKMMEADIKKIKDELMAAPQVMSATVERVFPSSIKITIEEHEPVMRLAVQGGNGQTEVRIVSRTGEIYKGNGYSKATLDRLPFLMPYQHREGGYLPLLGIERVASLLELARQKAPTFYRTWKVVSLEHFSGEEELPGQIIEVRSSRVPRVLFGARMDFGVQLDRLQEIFKYVAKRGDPSIKRVDLSLRGSAAVQFTSGRLSSF